MNMNIMLHCLISFLAAQQWTVLFCSAFSATITTDCYEGRVLLKATCSPSQYILIHSVESQVVSSCNGSSPVALWSRSSPEVHFAWERCNLQKERCTTTYLEKPNFLRVNYTCVDELSSIQRYNMCSNVSEVKSTPVYLLSPGYVEESRHHNYKNKNCTCRVAAFRTQGSEALRLTLFDMFTQLPETLTLKWSNGTSKGLTTVADNMTGYILNQETTDISSALYVSFVPRYPGQGYFWIGLESIASLPISITCNGGLGISPTPAPTSPPPTTETTSATVAKNTTTSKATTKMTTTTTASTTEAATTTAITNNATTPSVATSSPADMADVVLMEDEQKTIYIVAPTVVIAIVIVIIIVVIVKRRKDPGENAYEIPLPMNTPSSTDTNVYEDLGITNPADRDYYNMPPANGPTYENVVTGSFVEHEPDYDIPGDGVSALAAHDANCGPDVTEARDSGTAGLGEYDYDIPYRESSSAERTDADYEIPDLEVGRQV